MQETDILSSIIFKVCVTPRNIAHICAHTQAMHVVHFRTRKCNWADKWNQYEDVFRTMRTAIQSARHSGVKCSLVTLEKRLNIEIAETVSHVVMKKPE